MCEPAQRADYISALGYSLGYLGGGLLFALNVTATLKPHLFGLADSAQAIRLSFISVAIWWGVFTIPIMLFVKEPAVESITPWHAIKSGFNQLNRTFTELRKLRVLFMFLIAYCFYIDGVFHDAVFNL